MAYQHKVVRDLAYAVGLLGPPLLSLDGSDVSLATRWWETLLAKTDGFLSGLDCSPAPLDDFLAGQSGLGRVTNYHAALVQFWLMHVPLSGGADTGEQQPPRSTTWGLQVGGRRLTTDLKLLAAMCPTDPPDGIPGCASATLHVEPNIVFAIDASSLEGEHRKDGDDCSPEVDTAPLGCLISFDLDSNLQYKMRIMLHKLGIGSSPQVQRWVEQNMQRGPVASIGRMSGGIFTRLPAGSEAATPVSDHLGPDSGWWTEDVAALVAARPNSMWAICDWRHLLAPARIVAVERAALHFTRDIEGRPLLVPVAPDPPLPADVASRLPLPPLAKSARSFAVQQLQFVLIQTGFLRPSAIRFHSGIFGRHTETAVVAVQAVSGLTPTGVYDEATAEALGGFLSAAASGEQRTSTTGVHRCTGAGGGGGSDSAVWFSQGEAGSWRHGPRTADEANADQHSGQQEDHKVLVVQGSLATLIPHEPVISGAELILRVNAMKGIGASVAVDNPRLLAARQTLWKFACGASTDTADGTAEAESEDGAASGSKANVEWMPAGITEAERAVLHADADRLKLGHVSVGVDQQRRLLLWKGPDFAPLSAQAQMDSEPPALCPEPEPEAELTAQDGKSERMPTGVAFPGINRRGREIVGNPAALIEVVKDASSGQFAEGSRGFILPRAWKHAAKSMVSRTEPLVNAYQSRQSKNFNGVLSSYESVDLDYWQVLHRPDFGSFEPGRLKSSTAGVQAKRRTWDNFELSGQVDGSAFLAALDAWMMSNGLSDSDSRLHSPSVRTVISGAFARLSPPDQAGLLLAVMRMIADQACTTVEDERRSYDKDSHRLMARGHVILGALEWRVSRKNRKKDLVPLTTAAVEGLPSVTLTPAPSPLVSVASRMHNIRAQLLELVCDALKPSLSSLAAADKPPTGLCRMFFKALTLFSTGAFGDELDGASLDEQVDEPLRTAWSAARERATALATSCVKSAIAVLQPTEMDAAGLKPSGAVVAVLSMAAELLREVGFRWNDSSSDGDGNTTTPTKVAYAEANAVEVLHWLVRGAELSAAAHVAMDSRPLQVSMIEEILATFGSGGAKKAAKYVKQWDLSASFLGVMTASSKKKIKPNRSPAAAPAARNGDGEDSGASARRYFATPGSVDVFDVATASQLRACCEKLEAESLGLCTIDAEWEPFRANETPTKVSLLQIAVPGSVFLVDMLALADTEDAATSAADGDEPSETGQERTSLLQRLWDLLCSQLFVVGFGVAGDLKRICQSYPQLRRCFHKAIELQKIFNTMIQYGLLSDAGGRGLGATCEALVGCGIDKGQQTSHWGQRPLSAEQRAYAATDAFVLLPLLVAALRAVVAATANGHGAASSVDGNGAKGHDGSDATSVRASDQSLSQDLTGLAPSFAKWARPVSVADAKLDPRSPGSSARQVPLGRAGVHAALVELGWSETCEMFESTSQPDRAGITVKTIALLAHETQLILCVLALDKRLHISKCAIAVGAGRTAVRMLREGELVDAVGYPRGCIGPVGSRSEAIVLLDRELLGGPSHAASGGTDQDRQTDASDAAEGGGSGRLLCGGGQHGWTVDIAAQALSSLPNAVTAHIHAD